MRPPGAGADLDNCCIRERPGGASDTRGEVEIEKKVLAEIFLRVEAVRRDHLAQRR